jgi:hypothetical protein
MGRLRSPLDGAARLERPARATCSEAEGDGESCAERGRLIVLFATADVDVEWGEEEVGEWLAAGLEGSVGR